LAGPETTQSGFAVAVAAHVERDAVGVGRARDDAVGVVREPRAVLGWGGEGLGEEVALPRPTGLEPRAELPGELGDLVEQGRVGVVAHERVAEIAQRARGALPPPSGHRPTPGSTPRAAEVALPRAEPGRRQRR